MNEYVHVLYLLCDYKVQVVESAYLKQKLILVHVGTSKFISMI